MKKIIIGSILFFLLTLLNQPAFCDTTSVMAYGSMAVVNIFSLEFYRDGTKVLYDTNIPFTNISPIPVGGKTYVYADGRAEGDGKSDTAVICRTNAGLTWYLKVRGSSTTFPLNNFLFYMGQPWNRNLNKPADGQLTYTDGKWHSIPTSYFTLYIAGTKDKTNTPYGTLASYSFAINLFPGMVAGAQYNIAINYTVTTSP